MRAWIVAVSALVAALAWTGTASAGHPGEEQASEEAFELPSASASHPAVSGEAEDMEHLANLPKGGTTNSDLAFWGDLVYAGNYDGFRIIDASDPSAPTVLSDYECYGPQSDVGVWDARQRGNGSQRLLFVSVDSRQLTPECSEAGDPVTGWEGVRIFDVTDPESPTYITDVGTDCGSHTHTVVPARKQGGDYVTDPRNPNVVLLYVSSYPTGPGLHADDEQSESECGVPDGAGGTAHNQESIVEVPLRAPEEARVINELNTRTAIGCHDVGVHLGADLAAAACLTEGQIWDISNPAEPVIKHQIVNPSIEIWHSGSFTWDAETAIFGDEEGGAAQTHGCTNVFDETPGAIWFYDPESPALPVDAFAQQRSQTLERCTAHNYNVVPGIERDVLTSSFYTAGTGLVDFTDLDGLAGQDTPFEIAYFDPQGDAENPKGADTWSTYWYNGLAYANDINRGVDIFRHLGPETDGATRLHHLNPQTQEGFLTEASPGGCSKNKGTPKGGGKKRGHCRSGGGASS